MLFYSFNCLFTNSVKMNHVEFKNNYISLKLFLKNQINYG